jgi:hypothetical protein
LANRHQFVVSENAFVISESTNVICPKNSIFARFKETISPRVMKYISSEETTTMESGWDEELFYLACKASFETLFPKFGNFDDVRGCKEYLEGKPKFANLRKLAEAGGDSKRATRPIVNMKAKQDEEDKKIIEQIVEKELDFVFGSKKILIEEGKSSNHSPQRHRPPRRLLACPLPLGIVPAMPCGHTLHPTCMQSTDPTP